MRGSGKRIFPSSYISMIKDICFGIDESAKQFCAHLMDIGYKVEGYCEEYSEYWDREISEGMYCYRVKESLSKISVGRYRGLSDGRRKKLMEIYRITRIRDQRDQTGHERMTAGKVA